MQTTLSTSSGGPLDALDGCFVGDSSPEAAAVASASSLAHALRLLGRAHVGSNYVWLRRVIERRGLDTSHWTSLRDNARRVSEDSLVDGGTSSTRSVKCFILRRGLLPYVCSICKLGPEWNGAPLVLRLDHINGVRTDHRIENLRFLCPNCDSQSATFCGRNKAAAMVAARSLVVPETKKVAGKRSTHGAVCACGAAMSVTVAQCVLCYRANKPTKIEWPSPEDIIAEVKATSFVAVGKRLGVSDAAVRKYLRRCRRGHDTELCG